MPAKPSKPHKPVTARGEATRAKLLETAEALFGSKGYHATSIAEITREAGVGHGTFYIYFRTKEGIFRELIRHLSHQLRSAIREATEGLDDRLRIEETGLRTFFTFVVKHHDLYRIVFESVFLDPAMFRWYYETIAIGYARGLEAAMAAGQIPRQDPETLAYCLMGPAHVLGMRWVLWEGREPPPEVIDQTMRAIRAMMLAEPAPADVAPPVPAGGAG